ncbi:hypothetical protein PG985_014630 [Apiospora marii]|uniref:Uncharacterized protein n=1 Tax=Apiospora marii TaxID=335849 RepID=A0ABR1R4K0_9PEZI
MVRRKRESVGKAESVLHSSPGALRQVQASLLDGDVIRFIIDKEADLGAVGPVARRPGHEPKTDPVPVGSRRGVLDRSPVGVGDLVDGEVAHGVVVLRHEEDARQQMLTRTLSGSREGPRLISTLEYLGTSEQAMNVDLASEPEQRSMAVKMIDQSSLGEAE